ncbi:MAG TPA: COX15/CtaA family protein [Myxococcota bacterium]
MQVEAGRAGGPDAHAARRLALGFLALLGLTWALIVLGALVRAHGAGLACPDWPLCFGQLVPRFDLKVAFEYAHRVTAGGVSLAFAALAALALRREATRRATARLVALAAGLLGLQILLGALTVWHLLASWSVTAHLLTGTSFALALLLIACALRDLAAPQRRPARASRASVRALGLAAALLALQIALGGLVSSRYAGLACPEWPTCNGGLWFPTFRGTVGLHLLHRSNGYLLLAALAAAAWASRLDAGLRGPAFAALALGIAQVAVGIANVVFGLPVEVTGLHSALATALAASLALALRDLAVRARPSGLP